MDDQQVGMAIRTVRVRRGKRQRDVADEADVSPSTISRIERGRIDDVSLGTLRKVCLRLELRVDVRIRSRGADLDRMLNARHAKLIESIIARLAAEHPAWIVVPEVSFAIYGERGVIDIVAWNPEQRALLIVEVKTEIVDVGEMLGTLDRKRRLARDIVRDRGWDPATISSWIVIAENRTNQRRIAEHRATLRAAYPHDGRRMSAWLSDPAGSIAALSSWPAPSGQAGVAPTRRVRQRGDAVA